MQNETGKDLKTNSGILKKYQIYFQKLYTKQKNCKITQEKFLQKTHNKTFNNQKIPKTWNQATITLLLKKGNINLLKYWRPISLLCVDYKTWTKILSNRLKSILPDIISEEQNCSVLKRTIFNNLFLTRDIIKYTKEKNNSLCILQID